jgi:hypothetical protein
MAIPHNQTLTDLSALISEHVKTMTKFLAANKLPHLIIRARCAAEFSGTEYGGATGAFGADPAAEKIRDLALG